MTEEKKKKVLKKYRAPPPEETPRKLVLDGIEIELPKGIRSIAYGHTLLTRPPNHGHTIAAKPPDDKPPHKGIKLVIGDKRQLGSKTRV